MLTVKQEVDFDDLKRMLWSDNVTDVLNCVENNRVEKKFMDYLEEEFGFEDVDICELNDFVRFEWEKIYSDLGISEESEEE